MKINLKSALIIGAFSLVLTACGDSSVGILPPTISDEPVERYGFSTDEKTVGFINKEGEVVIKPRYALAGDFSQGLSAVGVKTEEGKIRWGYINHKGEFVVQPKYLMASDFSEERLAGVLKDEGTQSSLVFIDRRGKEVINLGADYTMAQHFSEGLAAVQKKSTGKWGFINKKGKLVIDAKFNLVFFFSEGLALAEIAKDDKILAGYIDRSGNFALSPQFIAGIPFAENRAMVASNNLNEFQIIDRQGQVIKENLAIGCHVEKGFSEGLLSTYLRIGQGFFSGYLCGYIDREGKVVIPPQFDDAYPFSEGLANVQIGGKWGYINKQGEMVIEPKFDEPSSFKNGLALVSAKPLVPQAYINTSGEYVWKSVEF